MKTTIQPQFTTQCKTRHKRAVAITAAIETLRQGLAGIRKRVPTPKYIHDHAMGAGMLAGMQRNKSGTRDTDGGPGIFKQNAIFSERINIRGFRGPTIGPNMVRPESVYGQEHHIR